ncbi:MAG: response regulator [Myxococcota bacterium]
MSHSAPRRILIVEDDPRLGPMLRDYLEGQGFHAELETRGDQAVSRIIATKPDLVVLDLMLPGLDGVEVCQRVRGSFKGPILILTARRGDIDHVAGLEAGADDYVVKPCKPRVLLARVRALLRRVKHVSSDDTGSASRLRFAGSLHIDRALREVRVHDGLVDLTSTEFDVLWLLASHTGHVVSRDEMYLGIRETPWDGMDRGMDIHISRIRSKLRSAGLESQAIKGVRGKGYQLALASDSGEAS